MIKVFEHQSCFFSSYFRVHGWSDMKSQQEQTQIYTDIHMGLWTDGSHNKALYSAWVSGHYHSAHYSGATQRNRTV